MANRLRDGAKELAWRERFDRFQASGLTVRRFCEQEQVREAAFYFWRRTIAERDGVVNPKPERTAAEAMPAFVPMVLTDRAASSQSIEILLAGGRVLRLPVSISADRLAEVIHALEAASLGQHSRSMRGVQ